MGCIVEKVLLEDGSESKLFKGLSEVMEVGAALETYLELTSRKEGYIKMFGENSQGEVNHIKYLESPKYKLAKFDTYQDQVDVMDFLLDEMIFQLSEYAGSQGEYNLSGININKIAADPAILPEIIRKVRTGILQELASRDSDTYTDEQIAYLKDAVTNLPSYIGEKGLLGPLGAKLKDAGIHIRVSENQIEVDTTDDIAEILLENDESFDVENHELGQELIYAMDILEMPTLNSVLPEVRLYIRSLRKVRKGYKWSDNTQNDLLNNPEDVFEVNKLGSFRPVRPDIILGKIFGILRGTQSINQMVVRLKNSLTENPDLIPLYEALMSEEPIDVPGIGQYSPLATAMFSMVKQHYDMNAVVETKEGVIVMDANNSSVKNKIKDLWSESIVDLQKSSSENIAAKNTEVDLFLSPTETILVENKRGKVVKETSPNKIIADLDGLNGPAAKDSAFALAAQMFRLGGLAKFTKGDVLAYTKLVDSNPRKYHKSRKKLKDSKLIKDTIKKVVSQGTLAGKDVFARGSEAYGESRVLNLLADASTESREDIHIGAHLSGRGTIVHAFNMASEAHDVLKRLENDSTVQNSFLNDPIFKNSILVNILAEDGEHKANFRAQTFDTLSNNNKRGSGTTYGKLSTYDALAVRLNMYFKSPSTKGYFHAFAPTQGDTGNLTTVVVPRLNFEEDTATAKLVVGGKINAPDVVEWIENQITSELTRIVTPNKLKGAKNYTKNSKRFNLFKSLNALDIDYSTVNKDTIESIVAELYPTAEAEFVAMIEKDVDYLIDKGLYKEKDNGSFTALEPSLSNKSSADLHTFIANNFIYGYEQAVLYAGDLAFYSDASPSAQMINLNKRFRLPFTPGVKLATNFEVERGSALEAEANKGVLNSAKSFYTGMDKTFNIKILADVEIKAELSAVYNQLGGGFNKEINIADGQGFISVKRHLQSRMARGIISDEAVDLLSQMDTWKKNNHKKYNTATVSSADTQEVLKHFYHKLRDENGVMVVTSLKYAVMPAIPHIFEQKNPDGTYKYPGLAEISQELNEDGGADEVVMESAVKAGIRGVTSLAKLREAGVIVLDNDGMRVPQVTPVTKKVESTFGSQIRKLIMGNHNSDITVLGQTADEALDNYDAAISMLAEILGEEAVSAFVNDAGDIDMKEIVSTILRDLEHNPNKNVEYYQESLRTLNSDGESLLPTNYPTTKNTIDQSIAQKFRTKVAKMKLPGFSAIQITSLGTEYNKGDISVKSDLKFVGINKGPMELRNSKDLLVAAKDISQGNYANYKITPAEVRISSKYFLNTLEKIASKHVEDNMNDIKAQVKEMRKGLLKNKRLSSASRKDAIDNYRKTLVKQAKDKRYASMVRRISRNGEIDIQKVRDAGLDEMVLYRIPTQGKNSMLVAKVKDFLHPSAGHTIQVPGEIVEQAGSDFDVDKLYIEMHKFGYNNGNLVKQGYKNDITTGTSTDLAAISQTDLKESLTDFDRSQAYIMEYHKAILSHPAYASELLIPNKTTALTKMAETLNVAREIEGLVSSIAVQEDFRNNNKSGNDMIGIASIASVAHAMAPRIGSAFVEDVILRGVGKEASAVKLGEIWNLEGTARISDEISEIQNAALDNANDPLLGHLNINEYTAPVALFLISAGQGIDFTTRLLNAPILRELANEYPKHTRLRSPANAHKEALKVVGARYGINTRKKSSNILETISSNDIGRLSTSTTYSDMVTSLQLFKELYTVGTDLSKFQVLMNLDSSGTPSTTAGIINKYTKMASIPGTVSNNIEVAGQEGSILPTLKGSEFELDASKLRVDRDKYTKSHLAAMERYLLNIPLQVLMASSPTATAQHQYVLRKATDLFGYVDEFTATKILAAYDTFVATNANSSRVNTSTLAEHMNNDYTEMLNPSNPDSTAEQLKEYRKYVDKSDKVENAFTENLTIVNQDGRQFVTFRNTVARAISGETRKEMMFFYEDLMDGNDVERSLAKSLADYAMLFYGYSKSINSYMEFLPPRAHTEYMGSNRVDELNVPLPELFRSLSNESLNDESTYSKHILDTFLVQYMQNNLSSVPLRTFNMDLLSESKLPLYAKNFVQGKWTLYKNDGMSYSPQSERGIPNLAVEYHSRDSWFHPSEDQLRADNERKAAEEANQEVMSNIGAESPTFKKASKYSSVKQYIDELINVSDYTVSNKEEGELFVDKVLKKLTENNESPSDIDYIMNSVYRPSLLMADFNYKRNLERGNTRVSFKELYQVEIANEYQAQVEYANTDIHTKIKNC